MDCHLVSQKWFIFFLRPLLRHVFFSNYHFHFLDTGYACYSNEELPSYFIVWSGWIFPLNIYWMLAPLRFIDLWPVSFTRSPSLGAGSYPIFLSRRFYRPAYLFSLNILRIQTPAGTTVVNHQHGLNYLIGVSIFTVRLKGNAAIVFLTNARSCRTELFYFAGKEG